MKLVNLIKNPYKMFSFLATKGCFKNMPDELYLKFMYRAKIGKKLNLKNPQTFNEKLQWLKLYNRKPEYIIMADKYAARDYIANTIGVEYLIPLLGVWDKFEDINFNSLPDKFVLKPTHTSGNIFICKDKSKINFHLLKKEVKTWLNKDYYWLHREWPYKGIPHKIIAEKYMNDDSTNELRDYKFFCFNGEPKILFVATERQVKGEEVKFDFFDMSYKHLDIKNGHPNATIIPEKPINFEKMKELAKILSKDNPHVRVDFYEVNEKIYFGELTFYHFSGIVPFQPEEWDYKLGEWIKIPEKNIK